MAALFLLSVCQETFSYILLGKSGFQKFCGEMIKILILITCLVDFFKKKQREFRNLSLVISFYCWMFPSHSKRICKRDKSTVGAPHGTAMLASLWFVTSASWCPFISHWDKLTRKCQLLVWLVLYGTVTKTHFYLICVQSRNLTDQLTYITLTVKRFCQWKAGLT